MRMLLIGLTHMLLAAASGAIVRWLPVRERVHKPVPDWTAEGNHRNRFATCDSLDLSLCWEKATNQLKPTYATTDTAELPIQSYLYAAQTYPRKNWPPFADRSQHQPCLPHPPFHSLQMPFQQPHYTDHHGSTISHLQRNECHSTASIEISFDVARMTVAHAIITTSPHSYGYPSLPDGSLARSHGTSRGKEALSLPPD